MIGFNVSPQSAESADQWVGAHPGVLNFSQRQVGLLGRRCGALSSPPFCTHEPFDGALNIDTSLRRAVAKKASAVF